MDEKTPFLITNILLDIIPQSKMYNQVKSIQHIDEHTYKT